MFLRFTTTRIDEDSKKPEGIFQAALSLLYDGELNKEDWLRTRAILDWYNEHLEARPKRFTASRAIFWFKSSADENIRRMWELVYLLRENGRHIHVFKCRRLANIVYEDELQVAAYPSEHDGKVTMQ